MTTTTFVDKETIIEAQWLNDVDAVVYDVLNAATTPAAARTALDVPQETAEIVPQVRINGAWQALSASVGPLHAATHQSGGTDELDHDSLLNGLGDKHIDHSAVSILAGSGMSGGGDITLDRTISFAYLLEEILNAGGYKIQNLGEPASPGDAVTKAYADNLLITAGANPWVDGVPANSIYYSAGFVGIGTDTPVFELDVRGKIRALEDSSSILLDPNSDSYFFGDSARLGVGTDSLEAALHVAGRNEHVAKLDINQPSADTVLELSNDAGGIGNDSYFLKWSIGGVGKGCINGSGNVGIGKLSPAVPLDVVGQGAFTGTVTANNLTTAGALTAGSASITNAIAAASATIPTLNGDVGIGISSPTEKLDVDGNIKLSGQIIGADNDWNTDITGIKYRKLPDGTVEVLATQNISSQLAQNLPLGYRPDTLLVFSVIESGPNYEHAYLVIAADGSVSGGTPAGGSGAAGAGATVRFYAG